MTYKVRVRPRDVEIEFETGSISEAVGILESEKNAIGALFAAAPWAGDQAATLEPPTTPTAETTKAKPGRRKANQPDPASASAPPPVPVAPPPAPQVPSTPAVALPPAAPTAPPPPMPPAAVPPTAPGVPGTKDADLGIPQFLDRRGTPPAPMPPAPPVPAAPPAPPVISKRLGGLVKAELEKRAGSDATAKAQLTDWLVKSGMILEGSEFNEALAVVSVETDENLKDVAAALGIQ